MTPLLLALALAAAPATLTLDEAVSTALSGRPSLRAAQGQARSAEASARVARGALLPQVGVDGRYSVSRDVAPGGSPVTEGDSASASLGADLLLWDFGRTSSRWRAARASAAAAGEDARASARDVVLEVRLAYLAVLEAGALEDVARVTLANQERHLRETEAMVSAGTRAAIDLARLRNQAASARAALVRAQNDTGTARTRLAVAMGVVDRALPALVVPSLPALAAETEPPDALLAEAARSRPELASIRDAVRAQDHTVTAAERWLLPSLRLGATASASGTDPREPGYGGSVGITLGWKLFDGLTSPAQADAERARLDVARAQLGDQEQRVFEEVEVAAGAVASARAQLPAAEEALIAARELRGLADARYREGVGTSLELADAELELASAAAQRVRVGYDLDGARAQLLRALGRDRWE